MSEAQNRAATYLRHAGRALERALLAFHFEGGANTAVLAELARFQNADGGFHGLEPDIRLAGSTVITTTMAFQQLRAIQAPADHPVVANACCYLRETFDAIEVKWPIIPPNIDDAPHAPWWVYSGGLSQSLSNPRAEIAGYLHDYKAHFPAALRETVTDAVVDTLLAAGDEMEMHDLKCNVRFFETPSLPPATKAGIANKLTALIDRAIERDPAKWGGYGLPPLGIVTSPDSPFAHQFKGELPANLNFLIEQQTADGSWGPNWSWADMHPAAWAQAERDWRSVLTLDNLRILGAFGR